MRLETGLVRATQTLPQKNKTKQRASPSPCSFQKPGWCAHRQLQAKAHMEGLPSSTYASECDLRALQQPQKPETG